VKRNPHRGNATATGFENLPMAEKARAAGLIRPYTSRLFFRWTNRDFRGGDQVKARPLDNCEWARFGHIAVLLPDVVAAEKGLRRTDIGMLVFVSSEVVLLQLAFPVYWGPHSTPSGAEVKGGKLVMISPLAPSGCG